MIDPNIINNYYQTMERVVSNLKQNFDKYYSGHHNDLDELINFISRSTATIQYLVKKLELEQMAVQKIDTRNKAIESVLLSFWCNDPKEIKKSREWLVNALILVVCEGFSYDGVRFEGKGRKILKNKIVKNKQCSAV